MLRLMTRDDYTFIFIGGLHRSGTSLFARCMIDHPAASGFHDTGVPEDEGQHLQTVFPPARTFGGPGVFGFAEAMHVTEESALVSEVNRGRLWDEWSAHWDVGRSHLIEKSPPNLIKARFLQAMFPNAHFIFLLRHPIAVAAATRKWARRTPLGKLLEHWAVCHEIMREDLGHLDRAMVIHYEEFVDQPHRILDTAFQFVGLSPIETQREIRRTVNDAYFAQWDTWAKAFFAGRSIRQAESRLESRLNEFGYSVKDPFRQMQSPFKI